MLTVRFLVLLIASFCIGAIPFAYIFVKRLKGIDVRTVGSGNVGATNAARALGSRWWGILILLLDMLKGVIPTLFGSWIVNKMLPWHPLTYDQQGVAIALGIAAFLGHCFNPFLKFKGGKGVATGLRVYLVLAPYAALTTLAVCVLIIVTTRLISLASITGAILLPFFMILYNLLQKRPQPWVIIAVTLSSAP
jgi:glycerol-3-phosphate acyltransferase PlsY